MGSYGSFAVCHYPFIYTYGGVAPVVMTLFRESDRREVRWQDSGRAEVTPDERESDGGIGTVTEYANTVGNILQRLGIMGFTLRHARADFEATRKELLTEAEEERTSDEDDILVRAAFEDFLTAFKEVIHRRLHQHSLANEPPGSVPPMVRYVLSDRNDHLLSFPCEDVRSLIRAMLEVCPQDGIVSQDVSDLLLAGYLNEDDAICREANDALREEYSAAATVVILTEGRSDTAILRRSLELLYPHLYEYYSFVDFDSTRPPGGAGFLASTVKVLAGAGLVNRVVALFDNDTAAKDAIRVLRTEKLPPRVRALTYPNLPAAQAYPTLGPSGLVNTDINGLACSIELYLGSDVLTQNGQMVPVQWTGFSTGSKQYHGEILQKELLRRSFFEKLEACAKDRPWVEKTDWSGIRAIWEAVFHAFE